MGLRNFVIVAAALLLSALPAHSAELCRVIPVEFPDLQFCCTPDQLDSIVHASEEYFKRQFSDEGKYSFELSSPVGLTKSYSYYGANHSGGKDARVVEAVTEALKALNPDTDFSGTDHLLFIMAGPDESLGAGDDYFWPQQLKLSDSGISIILDGHKFDSFAVCTEQSRAGELAGIGNFCHEFGHLTGLVDLYDTDGEASGGFAPGLGGLSLMADGNRNDGGRTPADLCCADYDQYCHDDGTVLQKGYNRLAPSSAENRFAVIPSPVNGKYDLVENRNGKELVIVRIDKSQTYAGFSDNKKKSLTAAERWALNEVNCRPDRQCAELGKIVSGYFFGDTLALTGIHLEGDEFVFNVVEPVRIKSLVPFQDGVYVCWDTELDLSLIERAGVTCRSEDGTMTESDARPTPEGIYRIEINGLKPAQSYSLSLHFSTMDGVSFGRTLAFNTQYYREDSSPFIMMDSPGRRDDGTFESLSSIHLRVRNVPDAVSTVWTFEGKEISAGPDGLWIIPGSGTLKAKVTCKDGSEDIIVKKITVR
ncbi:MAG: hypothetical protein MJY50_00075 [Bacteroidales bacterium]|nr:hypothetical protein [Bacteroidales bacterium]